MSESGYVLESFWFPYNPTGDILIPQTSAFSAPARPIMPPLSHSPGTLQACWKGANKWPVMFHIPNQPFQAFSQFFSSANFAVGSQKVFWKQYHVVVSGLFLPGTGADKILWASSQQWMSRAALQGTIAIPKKPRSFTLISHPCLSVLGWTRTEWIPAALFGFLARNWLFAFDNIDNYLFHSTTAQHLWK